MMNRCKLEQCPYNKYGFCSMKILIIDENGMCANIWKKGHQMQKWRTEKEAEKIKDIIIEDAEFSSIE